MREQCEENLKPGAEMQKNMLQVSHLCELAQRSNCASMENLRQTLQATRQEFASPT
jgi:DNA-binding transcriptional regulator YiaG